MSGGDAQLHRDIGRLEGRVMALESTVAEMKEMIGDMHETITQAKGGWKTLIVVGSIGAAIGTGLTKLLGVFVK